jgi:hypothetical protein
METSLLKRLSQARYHLQQLNNTRDDFKRGCYFSAFLPILKSVYYYIQTWMVDNGSISRKRKDEEFWSKIDSWLKNNADPNEIEQWECIMEVRNVEIHREIVSPLEKQFGGWWDDRWWNQHWWNDSWWSKGKKVLSVSNPKTGKEYELYGACDATVSITERLIKEYRTL